MQLIDFDAAPPRSALSLSHRSKHCGVPFSGSPKLAQERVVALHLPLVDEVEEGDGSIRTASPNPPCDLVQDLFTCAIEG